MSETEIWKFEKEMHPGYWISIDQPETNMKTVSDTGFLPDQLVNPQKYEPLGSTRRNGTIQWRTNKADSFVHCYYKYHFQIVLNFMVETSTYF